MLQRADTKGLKHDRKQAMFTEHFKHSRDLSDDTALDDIAAEIGLDRDEATEVLADQIFATQERQEQQFWTQQGIRGVLAIVFDRQHLVTGAQGVENYKSILSQLKQMRSS